MALLEWRRPVGFPWETGAGKGSAGTIWAGERAVSCKSPKLPEWILGEMNDHFSGALKSIQALNSSP